ncbi:inorganic phosphate transporter [Desulfobaculum bizertense]|uniref:Phosphate transporter n=1 Tax=Desulfobaculum bizertense DSM 18034 TaxID=1121442 RepID=A0A1T4VDD6_9BACT|nr:inorganic phosphate transporter [Desulfobaculum bizertense]UIJ37607.1 inorganic phosphate transporter [Desulfobaculum bizertense]SKA62937.1 inorganic phosphate transporter, PiT family [Desulfobaculum bizertense DSM 18034]
MDIYDLFYILSLGAGFLMAFNLGANDVANSMASAVGARAITVKQAVFIAGGLNFVGAVFLGSHVTATVSKGIINANVIGDPKLIMIGMFAALIAAALWVLIATLTALPVSSTHSIVGSILGFGLVAAGPSVVNWMKLVGVVCSWIISPFLAAGIAFFIFSQIRKKIFMRKRFIKQAKIWGPRWMAFTMVLVGFSFLFKTPVGKQLSLSVYESTALVALLTILAWIAGKIMVTRIAVKVEESVEGVETIFRRLQIFTSCYVALSQGANDVANAIGPIAAIYVLAKHHSFLTQAEVPIWLLAVGGAGIALGICVLGHRVMSTVGEKITTLTNTRGFAVDFAAATTVLVASKLGLPVSTTHATVGAVTGVGLARGFKAVDFSVLGKIVVYWLLTVPIAAFTSIVIFQILKWSFY